MTNNIVVNRFKIFFFYAIDLGYLLAADDDVHNLQEMRAKDELYDELCTIFDSTHVTASAFDDPCVESERIRSRANAATKNKGKNIWSELFFRKQVPIRFATEQGNGLSPTIATKPGASILLQGLNGTRNTGIVFEGCEFRIFREGTLSFRFEFSQNSYQSKINIDDFITILEMLESETFEGYLFRVKEIVRDWSGRQHAFQTLALGLRNFDVEPDGILKTSFRKHSCVFLENLTDVTSNQVIPVEDLQDKYFLLGILNKASWYKQYGKMYIEKAFSKNVGYRKDEIYLTDRDSSLILLADYWDPNKPLQHYIYDLMLAIEMQIAKLAYLNFILNNMQADPHSREALIDPSGNNAIGLVLRARSILTLAHESTDTNSFIAHGFTRNFIRQVSRERDIIGYLDSINRRIENINNAINLKTSVDIGNQDLSVNRRAIKWAIIALFISTVLSFVDVFLTHILPLMVRQTNQ